MKTKSTILALCLLGTGVTFAQNTTTTSSTMVTTNFTTDSASTATTTPAVAYSTNSVAPQTTTYSTTTTTDRPSDTKVKDGKEGRFGVYGGVNLSRFVGEVLPDNTYRPGYQVGLYYRSPGTIFGQIGAEYRAASANLIRTNSSSSTISNQIKGSINQHFLAIPVYVGVRAGGALGFRVQAGAEFAALVGVGANDFKLGNDDLKRAIVNGLVGVGINLGPITLDLNYNHGFVQVFDALDTKRNILALNVGLRF